jgi:hypothetical protein
MCGRYSTGKVSKKKFEQALDAELEEVDPSFNVCLGRNNPVIARIGGKVSSGRMRWGLVPNWSKEPRTDQTTARINALAEGRSEGQATGIAAVKADPTDYGLAPIEELTASGATPHTNGWYYQPEWGWLWTNAKTFPYVYRASTGGKQSGWLYFREGSAPPYFHDYATGTWSKLGE